MEEGGGGASSKNCERKKQTAAVSGNDEVESEDEKMEKFYTLIRNYREALDRQQIRIPLDEEKDGEFRNDEEIRRFDRNKKPRIGTGWVPAFEWEDFVDYDRRFLFEQSPSIVRLPPGSSGDNYDKDLQRGEHRLQPVEQPLPPIRIDVDAAGTSSGSGSGNCDGMKLDLTLRL